MEPSWRLLTSIVHPTDFSVESDVAFVHALKLALAFSAELRLVHVAGQQDAVDWADFPAVRDTLTRWRLLPPGAPRTDVAKVGIEVCKVLEVGHDPKKALVEQFESHPPSLLVLATYQHQGLLHWLSGAIAEPVARESRVPTLFIPAGALGFVAAEDGLVRLRRVLIPLHVTPDPQLAIDATVALAQALRLSELDATLLYVGPESEFPAVESPALPTWTWNRLARDGDVVEQILMTATETRADLVVMTTEGHVGVVDAVLGSTTERVLRSVSCPLLALPHRLSTKARLLLDTGTRTACPPASFSPRP